MFLSKFLLSLEVSGTVDLSVAKNSLVNHRRGIGKLFRKLFLRGNSRGWPFRCF